MDRQKLGAETAGWTRDGRAAVLIPYHPGCSEFGTAGVYLIRPGHKPTRIYPIVTDQEAYYLALWAPPTVTTAPPG